jgi:hypothetical protein
MKGKHLATGAEVDGVRADPTQRIERSAGNGLWLVVQSSGTKSWVYRYRAAGVQQKLNLGRCVSKHPRPGEARADGGEGAALTLGAARKAAAEAALDIERGGNPAAAKAQAKVVAKAGTAAADRHSVKAVYGRYLRQHRAAGRCP